ncbi:adenylate/guanylate cyclase domain-containing protein [Stappia sp. F7233]|uniref:Adenylate/guanylate cyclase domain-containing protein n=1 Tax=Stappia albiluteola TaxID=2758565 RepID=A0A839A8K9_9HYPH|nr:adenylate/guanylate cyclase domain-containing protein [Stappia albiluteola]MBA5775556.1 adenylate/guanylate cyclase domain-containing protein [Stappia albiluteola]
MGQNRDGTSLLGVDASRELRWNALRLVAFGIVAVNLFFESSHHNIVGYLLIAFAYLTVTATSILTSFYRPDWRNATMIYILIDAVLVSVVLYGNLLDTAATANHNLTTTSLVIPFVLLNHVALRQDQGRIIVFSSAVFFAWIGMLIVQALRHHSIGLTPFIEGLFNKDLGFAASFGFTAIAVHLFASEMQQTRLLALNADNMRRNLTRFFSPQVALTLQEEGPNLGLMRNHAAVMFIDIRAFTRLSENTSPEKLALMLSAYRQIVSKSVLKHRGVIDKFTGDGILAVFGVPHNANDDTDRALACAIEISNSLDSWLEGQKRLDGMIPSVGIGLHYGSILSGVVKSGYHDEFTVLGDTVNVAYRLERITKSLGASLVVSMDLVQALKFRFPSTSFMQMQGVDLPGRDGKLDILFLPRAKRVPAR